MNKKEFFDDNQKPLYRQIYDRFVKSIQSNVLIPGQRVPSIRTLASELQLSRNTVELAYSLLTEAGYLEARGPAGTIVSKKLAKLSIQENDIPPSQKVSHSLYDPLSDFSSKSHSPAPYQLGLPGLDLFPYKIWGNIYTRQLRQQNYFFSYPQAAGYQPLREAIASYLRVSRGLNCTSSQIFITAGYRGALNLISRTLMQPLDQVWIEDPCFPPSRQLLNEFGAELIPVPVDRDGMNISIGKELAPDARFALVTPAHQSPLGSALSTLRRAELLEWAQKSNAFIIEDDYDSEYRYNSRPLPVLASTESHNNVLYVGTFSKVLSPSLRLAYLVVPEPQLPRFNATCQTWQDGCSLLTQRVLTDFMQENHFSRHLRKTRAIYAKRRVMTINGLKEVFGERLKFEMPACGLHILAKLDDEENDIGIATRGRMHNLLIGALSARSSRKECGKGLILGFANVTSHEQALKQAKMLFQCFD
ncbi:MocR-like pyridoxine biosynthesis transcription factor PdxR [Lonsdalea quercina]|uniref:MocR-like pyridoxine biosynthesis transcription factor PdxR n=1 Tax=Lonsdalea quercina TaxID=71657 RepID=UPI003975426A